MRLIAGRRLAATAALLVHTACAGASRQSVTILIPQDILSLDPNREVDSITDSVLFNVYEPLVGFDGHVVPRPMLAESWEHPRPELWRFHLRREARFHDGTPLTAGLVRDALVSLRDAGDMEAGGFLSPIRDVVVLDEHTVDLVTEEPRAILANLPVAYITKRTTSGSPPLVGTGPYRVKEWVKGQRVVLERAPGYWGEAPAVRRAVFVPLADPAKRLARLRDASADIAYDVPPTLAGRPGPGVRSVHHEGLTVYYLGFNLRTGAKSPYGDVRVRRALHLAIDRRRIVDSVLFGNGSVATQPAPPRSFGFNPGLLETQPDLAKARALLAEAGYPRGFRTRLDFFSERLEAARLIQEDLGKIAVKAELNSVTMDEVYSLASEGRSALFLVGWGFSSGEASEFFEACLHTPTPRWGLNNYGGYSNPTIDEIAERNAAVLDPAERRDLLQRGAALAMEDLPVIPLYVSADIYGVRSGITLKPRADGEIWLPDVGFER